MSLVCFAVFSAPTTTEGQQRLGLTGNIALGSRFDQSSSDGRSERATELREDVSVGLNGAILDPRLITFLITGSVDASQVDFNHPAVGEDSRGYGFGVNMNLLQGKPYPFSLRFAQSHTGSGVNSDVLSSGITWHLVRPDLPSLVVDLDRVNFETGGAAASDVTVTTGRARIEQRFTRARLDADVQVQSSEDLRAETATQRYAARAGYSLDLSSTTSISSTADFFSGEDVTAVSGSFALLNRPDPAGSRSFGISVRRLQAQGQASTDISVDGGLTKGFLARPRPDLSLSLSAGAGVSHSRAQGDGGRETTTARPTGSATLIWEGLEHATFRAGSGLAAAYRLGDAEGDRFTGSGSFTLGATSKQLDPYVFGADYAYGRNLGGDVRAEAHQASLRASAAPLAGWTFGGFLDFREQSQRSSRADVPPIDQRAYGTGLSATYAWLRLSASAAGSVHLGEGNGTTSTVTQGTLTLQYLLGSRAILNAMGRFDHDAGSKTTRYEGLARLLYIIGRVTFTLEYRYGLLTAGGGSATQSHSVTLRAERPFGLGGR